MAEEDVWCDLGVIGDAVPELRGPVLYDVQTSHASSIAWVGVPSTDPSTPILTMASRTVIPMVVSLKALRAHNRNCPVGDPSSLAMVIQRGRPCRAPAPRHSPTNSMVGVRPG